MAGNEQLIDQVIAPVADEQVITLTKLLADLDIQMVSNIKSANLFNVTTSNSKTFAEYNKNVTQTVLALEKIQQAQNKTAQTTIDLNAKQAKLAADQQARDDKALLMLQRKQAAQAAADSKEIAQAEAKAAKLQAIAERQARDFPNQSQQPYNPATSDDSQTVRSPNINSPLIATDNLSTGNKQAAAATDEETAALLRQQEAILQLSPEYVANIELLASLKTEQLENATALKSVNTETAQGVELQTVLIANQLRLKLAVAETTVELNRQTKEIFAEGGAIKQLDASVLLLSSAYESLSIAERESEQGQKMGIELAALRTQQNELGLAVKNTKNNIGNYTESVNKSTVGMGLADKITNQFTRSIIRMGVQFVLIGVAFKAIEFLYDYIRALDMFNPVATEAEMRQKSLIDAFNSSDYQKGIENVEKLSANLDLAKKGIADSDNVVNEYNETIGKTFGFVNNLNDAQKGFIDNSDAYIKAIYLEAAAQSILANSAKEIGAAMAKNQADRNEEERLKAGGGTVLGITLPNVKLNKSDQARVDREVGGLEYDIKQREKRINAILANSKKAIENTYKDLDATPGQTGTKTGSDPTAELANKVANESLEREKILAQNKINNDKLSYKTRLQAALDFYNASSQIEKNNEALQLKELPAKDARREDVQKDAANKLLQLQEQYNNTRQSLNDKAYKQDQEHLKANLEAQKDLFKSVLYDPNQSYDMKLIALDIYNKKSTDLIKANYDEQVKEAGKNTKSIRAASDDQKKATIELANETASELLKIKKDNLAKILEQTKESEQEQIDVLDNGSKLALRALTEAKDKEVNALDLQRAKGKISEQKYNQELLDINDQYAIDRIAQEIATQQAILAVKEGRRDATVTRMKLDGSSPEDVAKFVSDSNKDIQGTKDKIADDSISLNNAVTKKGVDDTKNPTKEADEKRKAIEQAAYDVTVAGIDQVNKLRQQSFENEIVRLQKLGDQIDENANNEKLQVQNSIASSATKAREIAVIDAQTASAKKALQAEENKEKTKEAKADKEATIAKLIAQGALAVVTALTAGPIIGEIQAIATAAVVAVELATAIATPLPTYATGTDNYPGGLGLWGEAGTELATLPSGKKLLSTGPEIMNFPKGTTIMPHMQLMQMIRPEAINYVGGQEIGWEQVIKQLKKMEPKRERQHLIVNVDNGFENYKKSYLRR